MKTIHIFTRDLRIIDNTSLNAISKYEVIPIFIFTPEQVTNKSKFKSNNAIQFMVESLIDLNEELNNKLNLFYGEISKIISSILKDNNDISGISITKDYTDYAINREKIIWDLCKKNNLNFVLTEDYCINDPSDFKAYKKFTPYKKIAIEEDVRKPKTMKLSNIRKIQGNYSFSDAKKLYIENKDLNLHGGRVNGLIQISKLSLHKSYNKNRNKLSINTTELSAFIKFGCISIREVYYEIKKKLGSNTDLISQLIWRDFYFQIGFNFPDVLKGIPLKQHYSNIKWENNKKLLTAWKRGETGFPIVDAGMRQLNKTGFMHNRARLITASFLVKTLLVDWRIGERYFATKLYDYDPLVNNGNWQWISGSGADSQPYFRIFNPWLQSKTHDYDCKYIKKWIPELNIVDSKHIHKWYEYYKMYDIYIKPIVNFELQKKKVIIAYKKIY